MNHIFNFKMSVLSDKPMDGTFITKGNMSESKRMEPYVHGKGTLYYNCGRCGHNLLSAVQRIQVTNTVYECPKCGAYNQVNAKTERATLLMGAHL